MMLNLYTQESGHFMAPILAARCITNRPSGSLHYVLILLNLLISKSRGEKVKFRTLVSIFRQDRAIRNIQIAGFATVSSNDTRGREGV